MIKLPVEPLCSYPLLLSSPEASSDGLTVELSLGKILQADLLSVPTAPGTPADGIRGKMNSGKSGEEEIIIGK